MSPRINCESILVKLMKIFFILFLFKHSHEMSEERKERKNIKQKSNGFLNVPSAWVVARG
jgi:hypothetical protein